MPAEKINGYSDFINSLTDAGFSMGGSANDGIFAVVPWGWNEQPPYDTPVAWHTGDRETDPWEWRVRVLEESSDIAYSKVFFRKSGFITREWYPHFFTVRRGGADFYEQYEDGEMSIQAKRIYDVVCEGGKVALHTIKERAGFGKEEKAKFDKALTELQMSMYITMCGIQKKESNNAWASTVFCTVESFWGEDFLDMATQLDIDDSFEKIKAQILKLNPAATDRKIAKFIRG